MNDVPKKQRGGRVMEAHKKLCAACGDVRTVLRLREILGAAQHEDVLKRAQYVAEKLVEFEGAFEAAGFVTASPRATLLALVNEKHANDKLWAGVHAAFSDSIRSALGLPDGTVPELVAEITRLRGRQN